MSHFPKLEVFKIELKPIKNNRSETFLDIFKIKGNIGAAEIIDNKAAFQSFLKYFIKEIDQEDFYIKSKKGFTTYDANQTENSSIKAQYEQFNLYGFAEGGDYGKKRTTAELGHKNRKNSIGENSLVMDRFFFLMHLKPDSKYGILMILSYSYNTITQLFIDFIKDIFKHEDLYYKPNITRYIPEKFKSQYKEESVLKTINFETIATSNQLSDQSYTTENNEFIIKIQVSSKKALPANQSSKFYDVIKEAKFGFLPLKDFFRKTVKVEDTKGQNDSFEIDNEFDPSPKIYLDGKIEFNVDGTPVDESLLEYSLSLLKEICEKIYPINYVQER